ncbi:MAG: hypothetical protein RMJ52_04985, partial [Gemmataceae bacterium]|nr:hypothetical protein [Gemmataceae bacterium]
GRGGAPDGLVVDQLQGSARFFHLTAAGSMTRGRFEAQADLDRLARQLARFIDLGDVQLAGRGSIVVTAEQTPSGTCRVEGEARIQGLRWAGLGGWHGQEATLSVTGKLAARLDRGRLHRVEGAQVRLTADGDELTARLIEPMPDLKRAAVAHVQVSLEGNLAAWRRRLPPAFAGPLAWDIQGNGVVTIRSRWDGAQVVLEDVQASVRDFQCRRPGVCIREPSLELRLAAEPIYHGMVLRDVLVRCPTLTASFPRLAIQSQAETTSLTGRGAIEGDVARLVQWLELPAYPFAGRVAVAMSLQPAGVRQRVHLDATLSEWAYGSPSAAAWRGPTVRLVGHAAYDSNADHLQIDAMTVQTTGLALSAAGEVRRLMLTADSSLAGQIQYDLAHLESPLSSLIGTNIRVAGRGSRPFRLRGALSPASGQAVQPGLSFWTSLHGEFGFDWTSLEVLGFRAGPAAIDATLADGWVHVRPISCDLNNGRLRLGPSLRLVPGPCEVHLAPGLVVERARLTPSLCAGALGYALPLLARVTEADGEISLALAAARVPLSDWRGSHVAGQLTVHSAHVTTSPLLRELGLVLRNPPDATLVRDNAVPFQLLHGRVHHRDLQIRFPDVIVRTEGSVGLDGSLALTAEMPIPPNWLGQGPLAAALAQKKLRLPIGGTLSQPRIDDQALRAALGQLGKGAAGEVLRRELERGLDRLLKPR